MAIITSNFFPILCLCFTVALCDCNLEERYPRVVPGRYTDYDMPFIEYNCGANLKPGEWLTWYKVSGSDKIPLTTTEQKQPGHGKLVLLWPLALLSNGDKIFCAIECLASTTADGIPIYQQMSTQNIPIIFNRKMPPLNDIRIVMVTPEVFVDDGKSFTEFTCWAFAHQRELLSWYQIKDSKEISLASSQQENHYGYIKVKLMKTLEPSDNGTQLYCAKEEMLPNITIAKVKKSQEIQITFQRQIQPLETPHITVKPHKNLIIVDGNEELKFVCSGSKPVDGRNITWFIQGPDMKITYPHYFFNKSVNTNTLTLRMEGSYHGSQLYCAQDYKMYLQSPETDQKNVGLYEYHYGELVRSNPITLLQRNNRKDNEWGPWLKPHVFVDDGKPVVEFTCSAYSFQREMLTWKHVNAQKQTSMLAMSQQKSDNAYIEVKLRKTLEPSDNGTTLYCVKERMVPNTWPLKFKTISDTPSIPIMFQRHIQDWDTPYVLVDPSSDVMFFDEEDELEVECRGSPPVDGRGLWWYLEGHDTRYIPLRQSFDKSANVNRLKLRIKQSYHRGQLYCAQTFKLEVQLAKPDEDVTVYYGELARSAAITLLYRRQGHPEANNSESPAAPPTQHLSTTVTQGHSENVSQSVSWTYWLVAAVIFILLLTVMIFYIVKQKRTAAQLEMTQNALGLTQHTQEEVDRMGLRPPMPSPPELIYDSVYDHGAGLLRRPRRWEELTVV